MAYLLRRLAYGVGVIIAVATVVFALARASGDPALLLLGEEATAEDAAALRASLGLDQPILVQYVQFLGGAVTGDFGDSLRHGRPAFELVLERVPATLQLAGVAFLFVLFIGIPLGIVAGLKKGSITDVIAMGAALIGQSVPSFWLGIMLIMFFSVHLGWFPASGRGGLEYLLLPGFTLAVYTVAITARLQRSSVLESLRQDYVRTARSKGVRERAIVVVHVLRNSAIPVVTMLGIEAGVLLGGSVIVETVFSYPGMGQLAVQAIVGRDFPVVQTFVICIAAIIVLLNLLVDLAYTVIDPRIKVT